MKVPICVFEVLDVTEFSLHLDNGNSTRNFSCTRLGFVNSFEECMQSFWQKRGCF